MPTRKRMWWQMLWQKWKMYHNCILSYYLVNKNVFNVIYALFSCILVLVNQWNQVVLKIGTVVTYVVKKMNFANMTWVECKDFFIKCIQNVFQVCFSVIVCHCLANQHVHQTIHVVRFVVKMMNFVTLHPRILQKCKLNCI